MNRRAFLALASGLLVPTPEPVRRYFFAPRGGWGERVPLYYSWADVVLLVGGVPMRPVHTHEHAVLDKPR